MASSVTGILGTAADGEAFTGQAHRLGMASHATIINDGVGALTSRSGIIPGAGTPLNVAALGTPAMKVTVLAGTCAIQSTSYTGGVHTVTLTTATDLDIAASNATNPRIDLVVAKVFADGTSATTCTVEVVTGTPAASPVRPSPSATNTHYFPLAQVRVEANATTIVAAKVTKISGDGQYTCAPGGTVRYAPRQWSQMRNQNDGIGPNGFGNFTAVTIPAADCVPGIYLSTFQGEVGLDNAGSQLMVFHAVTPSSDYYYSVNITSWFAYSFNTTRVTVIDTKPATDQIWRLDGSSGPGLATATFKQGSRVEVTRIADL